MKKNQLFLIAIIVYLLHGIDSMAQIWPQPLGIMGDSRALEVVFFESTSQVVSQARLFYPSGPFLLDTTAIIWTDPLKLE